MRRAVEMRVVFERFERSGLSLKAFGEREGISYTTLQYWRRKLGEGAQRSKKPAVGAADLTPVRVIPDSVGSDVRPERVEVWLSNGISLEVPAGIGELDLRRLVGVLVAC